MALMVQGEKMSDMCVYVCVCMSGCVCVSAAGCGGGWYSPWSPRCRWWLGRSCGGKGGETGLLLLWRDGEMSGPWRDREERRGCCCGETGGCLVRGETGVPLLCQSVE